MLEAKGLVKRFGGFTAVNNVSFRVDAGEILGLIGPNGSGKSTIFNMLSGTLAPTLGSISFDGVEIAGLPPHRIINRGIGRTFQIPRPFRRLSLFENVALAGFYGQGRHSRAKADAAAEKALAMVGLPTDRHATVDGLGAAGLKKLELAKALATGRARFFRPAFAPTLALALDPGRDRQAFAAALEDGLNRRLAVWPEPLHTIVQSLVLHKMT